ncbi:cilia- and flagella-associated protein 184 [Apteryx mantelli]|uniref:Cilia- and flagella-associated protein 184 n=1 Tax=Apteryx mantelli TaxID=2696672 RepID=A0ABM4EKY7_9AVES
MEAPGGGPRPAAPEGPEGPAGMEEPGPAGPEEPGGAEESRSEEPGPEVPGEPAGAEELGPEEPRPAGLEVPRPEEPGPAGPAGAEEPVPEEPAGPEEPGPAGAGEEKEEAAAAAAGEAPPAEGAARARGGAGRSEPPAEAERRGSEGAALAGAARGSEGSDEDEGSEDEEEDEDPRARAALLEEQRGLASERERLRQASCRLQLRLGQLLRLRRGEEPRRAAAGGEQRYAERLRRLRERRRREAAGCERRVAARRRGCRERRARAEAAWAALQARERRAALRGPGRRLGGGAAAAAAAAAAERVQAAERAVSEAHVENIKLKHEIQKLEAVLKAQGEGTEGVHFIDFEQLKKENQKYSEKIDDLSEELLKLQKKISNTVHIFSQFREKLQFVEAENQGRKAELMDVEAILSQKRDILTKTKQIRDRLRINNLKLQQKCGLLGNDTLLRDFEEKVDTVKLLSQRLEILQHHHAGLILTCNGIKKKIKEATSFVPC